MINVKLTDEERKDLIIKTNTMIDEINFLSMDLNCLRQSLNRVDIFKRLFDKKNRKFYKLLDKTVLIKSRRLLSLQEKINENKEILGIKKVKRKTRH